MMKLGLELTIKPVQELQMTPQLIQSIKILQYTQMELKAYVDEALQENPVLESTGDADSLSMQDFMRSLEGADETRDTYRLWETTQDPSYPSFEVFLSSEETLADHLLSQLNMTFPKGQDVAIGTYIIGALNGEGYLTMSVKEVAALLRVREEDVERVRKVINTFDPPGVACLDLADCLKIQLETQGLLNDQRTFIIDRMLEALAENRIALIAETLKIPPTEAQLLADSIRSLNPKPGSSFGSAVPTPYIVPDLYVEESEGRYRLRMNEKGVPTLRLSAYYKQILSTIDREEDLARYLQDRFRSAVWLIRSIEQRQNTVRRVAEAIVRREGDFFDRGEIGLYPLTLRDIAEELGIHESTVSRAIQGKYMATRKGTFALGYFFTSSLSTEKGGKFSSRSIKAMIRTMIEQEDPREPVSDQKLCEALQAKDVVISRRTVAKYREAEGIPASSKRRRF